MNKNIFFKKYVVLVLSFLFIGISVFPSISGSPFSVQLKDSDTKPMKILDEEIYNVTVQMEHPYYFPGDEVNISIRLTENGNGFQGLVIPTITNPLGDIIFLGICLLTDIQGYENFSFLLDLDALSGTYIVSIEGRFGPSSEIIMYANTTFEVVSSTPINVDAHGPYEGFINEPIQFFGSVSGGVPPYSWFWNFGDGNTSTEQNPIHTYILPNEYTINLTVVDNEGRNGNTTTIVTIRSLFYGPIEVVSTESTAPASDCSLAVDAYNTVHVAWQDQTDYTGYGTNYHIFYKMKPQGKHWSTIEVVSTESTGDSCKPSLAVESDGTVHIAWYDNSPYNGSGTNNYIFYKMKPAGGNWTVTEVLSPGVAESYPPALAVGINNTIHLVWMEDWKIVYRMKSFDGNWTPIELVSTESPRTSYSPAITVDINGTVHVAWNEQKFENGSWTNFKIYYKSKPLGGNWTSTEIVSIGHPMDARRPSIAVDNTGTVHIAWWEGDSRVGYIWYAKKLLGGNWIEPEWISTQTTKAYRPSLGVETDGTVHIVWDDYPMFGNNFNSDIYYRQKSQDGNWSATELFSNSSLPSLFPSLTIGTNGTVHVAWQDFGEHEPGTFLQIFYRKRSSIPGNEPPYANFIYSPENPMTINPVSFTDTSYDLDGTVVNWSWDFGDGNISESQNPMHQYIYPGIYSVTLKVTDDDGSTDNKTKVISIIETPPTNIFVDDDFTPSTPGWGYDHFNTIQDGINAVLQGGTVYVYTGSYYENVIVDKTINLIGENKNTTTIDGGYTGNVVDITADNVNINGFSIQHSGEYMKTGLKIQSEHCNIFNNNILDNYDNLVLIVAHYNSIFDNEIFFADRYGILISSSKDNTLFNNFVHNNVGGIQISAANGNIIKNSLILNNYDGISISYSDDNIINNNIININTNNGIYFYRSDENILFSNTVSNSTMGVYIHESSDDNIIFHNNLIDNLQHASDACANTWDDGYPSGGNYWDDYNGTDANGDGIGDTPYNISSGSNQDRYPLMEPWSLEQPSADIYVDDNANPSWYDATHVKTIQEGINNASSEYTVFVYSGLYLENLEIHKALTLIGENKETTIIDGGQQNDVIYADTASVNIANFTIQNSSNWGVGIICEQSNSIITDCIVKNTRIGIVIGGQHGGSSNSVVEQCTFYNNLDGISLFKTTHATVQNNVFIDGGGIYLSADTLQEWNTQTIENNILNGKLIRYYKNTGNIVVPIDTAQIILANCTQMTIQNSSFIGTDASIQLGYSSFNTIRNNAFERNGEMGIMLVSSPSNTISQNTFTDDPYSVTNFYSPDTTITENKFSNELGSGESIGIYIGSSTHQLITRNTFTKNLLVGIYLEGWCNDSTITENIVDLNQIGYVGIYTSYSCSFNLIQKNIITNCTYFGLGIEAFSNNNTITQNTIVNNTEGILISFSQNNTLSDNIIRSNGIGISTHFELKSKQITSPFSPMTLGGGPVPENSTHNIIYHNNFINNTQSAYDPFINIWDNVYPSGGNYWSDYNGTDGNGDGIGDTPYNIFGGANQDRFPFMRPDGWLQLPIPPADIYVDDNAAPSWYDHTHVRTIQEGINNASTGNTIFVYSGTYHEHVTVNKTVELSGESRDTTIIDGGGNSRACFVFRSVDHIKIHGFTITNEHYGILLSNSNNNTISGNIFTNTAAGIMLGSANNNNISDNIFSNNFNGIYLESFGNTIMNNIFLHDGIFGGSLYQNIIQDNTVNDKPLMYLFEESDRIINETAGQIILVNCNNITIRNQNLSYTAVGIELFYTNHCLIDGNILTNDSYGLYGIYANNNLISYNNISNNDAGMVLGYTNTTTISNNFFSNNIEYGIGLFGFNDTIIENTFKHNGVGIYSDASRDNLLYHNNFLNNDWPAVDTGNNTWDNGYPSGGNYWSDYNGTDVNHDGIGDIPYTISGDSNQDRYPLMHPFILGDVNNDGLVNWRDVDPFVAAMNTQVTAFQAQHPTWNWRAADCNQDGYVNWRDINPFVTILSGG